MTQFELQSVGKERMFFLLDYTTTARKTQAGFVTFCADTELHGVKEFSSFLQPSKRPNCGK